MPRQEKWIPRTSDERLDRLESYTQIRQLVSRYALALDTRNAEDMVELFVEDVQVGRDQKGRDALGRWFTDLFATFGDSIHFVGNHVIDFDAADRAHGVTYCRDELEKGKEWHVGFIQYWDSYERHGGSWYFRRRKLHRWYMVDAVKRPHHGAGLDADNKALGVVQLPDAWPSWGKFWQESGRPPR